jgi:drug/metabolite transporter (DMT)-like permease
VSRDAGLAEEGAAASGGRATVRSQRLAVGGLAFITLVWGYNWVVMKAGLAHASPFAFAAIRMLLSSAALMGALVVLRRPLRPQALGYTALLGLLQSSPLGLTLWALRMGGVDRISILSATMPFWLLLLAWIVLGERMKGIQWAGVALGFVGLMLVARPWALRGGLSILLVLVSALCSAGGAVVVKVMRERGPVDVLSMTMWQMVLGSIPVVIVAGFTWSGGPDWSPSFIAALAYNVVLGTALAMVIWFAALHALPAATAGMVSLAVPVIGIVAAWLQFGETPDLGETLGMAAIVCALTLVTFGHFRTASETPVLT